MTYATGTVTDANPGPALYAAIEPTLFTAGFTLEDTVVIGSRTHKVLKSDATDNDQGLTWFLDISFPTTGTSGGMLMTPFEDFDPDTDLAYRGPYSAAVSTIDGDTFSRYGSTGYALESNWANSAAFSGLSNSLSASSTGWFLSATTDRVVFASTVSGGQLHYVGFFEPTADHEATAGADMFPLVVAHFDTAASSPAAASGGSTRMSFTRVPKLTGPFWSSQGLIVLAVSQMGGRVGSGGDFAATGKTNLARPAVIMGYNQLGSNAAASAAGGMGLVGYLFDVANTWTDGTITRGDDLTDANSDTWIGVDDANNIGIWFKAV